MIYESDLIGLTTSWKMRLQDDYEQPYKDALNDCIYELTQLINSSLDQEMQELYYNPWDYLPPVDAMDYIVEETLRQQEKTA